MSSFADTLKQLGPSRLAVMGGVLVTLLLFFIFVTFRISSPELKLLYGDLSTIDASAIATKLQTTEIPYEISQDGSRVLVAEDKVEEARMLLAADGLPNGGNLGYEIFDQQSSFGTTNFVQNINQVRALEGELARTISSLQSIRQSRVHLVLPQRKLFSRESQQSSGSVFLGLQPGARLKNEQILAIQSLVASAVPGLDPDTISVIDSDGNLLAKPDGTGVDAMASNTAERQLAYEKRVTQSIEDIVGRVVGFGNVRATVTADLNFDRISTNEELYDPEGQVVRSTQVTSENSLERDPPSGEVSVAQNLPGVGGDILADPKPALEESRSEEVTNFEISRTVRSSVREVGEVTRLSIAVLVDGTYSTTETEEGETTQTYQARSQNELEQIENLVRSAVGFDETRGDTIQVVNMQFADVDLGGEAPAGDTILGFEKDDLLDAVEVLAVAVMIILIILLVVQPMLGRILATDGPKLDEEFESELLGVGGAQMAGALEGPSEGGGQQAAISGPQQMVQGVGGGSGADEDSMIDMQDVEGKVKASSIKKVEDIVENYPSETVNVLRGWMSSES